MDDLMLFISAKTEASIKF